MSKASIIFVILSAILVANPVSSFFKVSKEPNFFYQNCRFDFGNYTTNSSYESNLKTVLTTLDEQASMETFYNTSAGTGANTVYGQYNCRGDVDSEFCSKCIKAAAQDALKNCSSAKAGVIWYEECTLRYRNESMFGIYKPWPEERGSYVYLDANVTNPDKFIAVLNETINTLILKVAYGNGTSKFATAEVGLSSDFDTLYSLVQCSPDLNGTDCQECLNWNLGFIHRPCCGKWSQGVYVLFPNCQMIYSTYGPFYNTPIAPPPPPPSPTHKSPPPPVITGGPPPPSNINGGSRIVTGIENLKLGIVTVALLLLMLVLNS